MLRHHHTGKAGMERMTSSVASRAELGPGISPDDGPDKPYGFGKGGYLRSTPIDGGSGPDDHQPQAR
jgi:hypothetical protein